MNNPKYLHLAAVDAVNQVTEKKGRGSHPRLQHYFDLLSKKGVVRGANDDDPWCGYYVGGIMLESGLPIPDAPGMARSWLKWGVKIDTPKRGCVVIFERPGSPTSGHVGIVTAINKAKTHIRVLGGNQNDRVCNAWCKINRPGHKVLGYRKMPGDALLDPYVLRVGNLVQSVD